MRPDACLRLILPQSLEEQVVDHLLKHPEWVGSFTAYAVDGHGTPNAIASNAEQVRGRAGRVQIEILTTVDQAQFLVARLRGHFSNAEVVWWIGPVTASGDFS